MRFGLGAEEGKPAKNVVAYSRRPITIQSSPIPIPSYSTTSSTPVTNAASDAGMKTRLAIQSTSAPNVAEPRESPDMETRRPKNCIMSPPPTQVTAMAMWRKSRRSDHVMRAVCPLVEGADPSSSRPTTKFTNQTTIVAPTYVQKPSIEKRGAIHSASASIATLITK